LSFRHFGLEEHRFAFVLTHDVEAAEGQAYVRTVADLDEGLGFRSSFNFVPERYPLIEYDLSFFDTDPLEPIPGAVMSIRMNLFLMQF
jgi:hypothetical protein